MRKLIVMAGLLVLVLLAVFFTRTPREESAFRSPSYETTMPTRTPPDTEPFEAAPRETHTTRTRSALEDNRHVALEPDFFDFDDDTEPTREVVRASVEKALSEHFDEYRLSSDEVDRVADAMVSLRKAQIALRSLPMDESTAEQRRRLVEQVGDAASTVDEVLEMDIADFTEEATQPGIGVDHFDPNEPVPEGEFIESRR